MIFRMVLTGTGVLSLLYFVGYLLFVGLNNSFLFFWLFIGVFLPGWGFLHDWLRAKDLKKWIFVERIAFGVCIFLLAAVVVTLGVIIRAGVQKPGAGADYVVILGAHVYGERMSTNLRYRVELGLQYLNENPDTKVILSGGQGVGEDITEAEAMRRYLAEQGVPESKILLEESSVNTDENIRNSKRMTGDDDMVVIVTNRFHLFRAVAIAKKQGMKNVQGLGQYIHPYTIPNCYLREVAAVWKYKLCGQI